MNMISGAFASITSKDMVKHFMKYVDVVEIEL